MYIVKGSLRSRWLCRADVDAAFLQLAHDCAYLCRQQGTSASRKRDRQQWVADSTRRRKRSLFLGFAERHDARSTQRASPR